MSDEDEIPSLGILLYHVETGTRFHSTIAAPLFWRWYDAITSWGIDEALEMAVDSASLVAGEVTDKEREYLRRRLEAIQWHVDMSQNKTKEEQALQTSYEFLSRGDWTREQSLRFAQNLIDPSITATSWRLRLMRYAKKHGKPPLGSRGRPRKPK